MEIFIVRMEDFYGQILDLDSSIIIEKILKIIKLRLKQIIQTK